MSTHRLTLLAALLTLAPVAACDDKEPGDTAGQPDGADGAEDPEGAGHRDDPKSEDEDEDKDEDEDETPADDGADWPEEAVACPDLAPRACTTPQGEEGTSHCVVVGDGHAWSACIDDTDYGCLPGDNWDMGCIGSYCVFDGAGFYTFDWQTDPDCATPLVVSFDAAPVRFDAVAGPDFDFAAAAGTCTTDWPTVPWLALDRDHNGQIDSGRELFGSGTRLAAGGRATHGFEALAELDADGDGRITPADPRFAELVLWSDSDADRVGELAELMPADARGLVAIHLDYQRRGECDERGNCGLERAAFEYRDATGQPRIGEIVDVYLACQ